MYPGQYFSTGNPDIDSSIVFATDNSWSNIMLFIKWISSWCFRYLFESRTTIPIISTDFGAKYLMFFSSRSIKMREKCISFAQLVLLSLYIFLREVCLLFNFWMMKFTITFFWHNCEFYYRKLNTLPSKNIQTEQN